MYKLYLKRIFDFFASLLLLIVLSPIIILIILILLFINNGQPFFLQERPGQYEKKILIIKFKSMTDAVDDQGKLLPDNQRLTNFGAFLRKASLDELPQLVNVLWGDMSLVGPRPLLFRYLDLYKPEQKRRHNVRPGITGWAQVNGRNSIKWQKKFEYDIYYVDHISFSLDVKILWMTLLKVIRREGVNQGAERPMQPFNGQN